MWIIWRQYLSDCASMLHSFSANCLTVYRRAMSYPISRVIGFGYTIHPDILPRLPLKSWGGRWGEQPHYLVWCGYDLANDLVKGTSRGRLLTTSAWLFWRMISFNAFGPTKMGSLYKDKSISVDALMRLLTSMSRGTRPVELHKLPACKSKLLLLNQRG